MQTHVVYWGVVSSDMNSQSSNVSITKGHAQTIFPGVKDSLFSQILVFVSIKVSNHYIPLWFKCCCNLFINLHNRQNKVIRDHFIITYQGTRQKSGKSFSRRVVTNLQEQGSCNGHTYQNKSTVQTCKAK